MPEESTDLAKIANVLALLLTKETSKSATATTLQSCGFSNKEIAGLTGTSEASIRAMLSQSRRKAGEKVDKPLKSDVG